MPLYIYLFYSITTNYVHWTICCQRYITFYYRNLRIFVINQGACPWQTFLLSIMFVGKARSRPYDGAPERCFPWVDPGLSLNVALGKGRFAKEKHYLFANICKLQQYSFLCYWVFNEADKLVSLDVLTRACQVVFSIFSKNASLMRLFHLVNSLFISRNLWLILFSKI